METDLMIRSHYTFRQLTGITVENRTHPTLAHTEHCKSEIFRFQHLRRLQKITRLRRVDVAFLHGGRVHIALHDETCSLFSTVI